MKTLIQILFLFSFQLLYTQGGWQQVPSGTTANLLGMLNSVDYQQRIWVLGENGLILVSADGGSSFSAVPQITSNDMYDMEIIEQSDGGNVAVGEGGTILKTTDLGLSWSIINSGVTSTLRAIMDPVIVGDSTVLVSTNGGSVWARKFPPVVQRFNDVYTDFNWVIIVGNNGIILRYNIGTDAWAVLSSGTTANLRSIHALRKVINGSTYSGYIVTGDNGVILTSTNLGNSWQTENPVPAGTLNGIVETGNFNSELIWACGSDGKIFYSQNDGISWNSAVSPVTSKLNNISFGTPQHGVPAFTGFIVGDGGVILRTLNFGLTSLQQINSGTPSGFSLSQNNPNPFNPVTRISFSIPEAEVVNLNIYDIKGAEVANLLNKKLSEGTYEINWDASAYPSGVYFYKLTAGSFTDMKKMVLIK